MAHFIVESPGGQFHIYCRDADTYEAVLTRAEAVGGFVQIRPGTEGSIPPSQSRFHLFLRGTEVFAVNLDDAAHEGEFFQLPAGVARELRKIFPEWAIPENGLLPTAPFAASMLSLLTDF